MKTKNARNYHTDPMNALEAEIAITGLHATGEFSVLRKLNMERDPRFSLKSATGILEHADGVHPQSVYLSYRGREGKPTVKQKVPGHNPCGHCHGYQVNKHVGRFSCALLAALVSGLLKTLVIQEHK